MSIDVRRDDRLLSRRPGIPVDLRDIETELTKLWGPAAEQVGGPELENPHVTRIVLANLVVECLDGDGESLGPVLETVIARFPCRAIVVLRVRRPRAPDHGRSLGALPLAGPGSAPGLLRADRAARRAEGDRPAPRRRPSVARGRLADGALVDRRPAEARAALSRPGRRVLAAGSRPARPRRRRGRTPPGPRPGHLPVQPRHRLVRPGSLARAGRAVLRSPVQLREPETDRLGARSRPYRPIRPVRPGWPSGWWPGSPVSSAGSRKAARCNSAGDSESVSGANSRARPATIAVDIVTRPIPPGLPASPRLAGVTITTRTTAREPRRSGSSVPRPTRRPSASRPSARLVLLAARDRRPRARPARRVAAALESSRLDPPFQKALPIALWLMDIERS